jgi:anaerobic C4-dicarboxylate transporter
MDKSIVEAPRLIETGAVYYMSNVLNSCHSNRVNIYLYALNIGVFVLFVFIVCLILYNCHKSKLSPEQNYQKQLKEQEYILSKIRFYKEQQASIASRASITGLPTTDPRAIY